MNSKIFLILISVSFLSCAELSEVSEKDVYGYDHILAAGAEIKQGWVRVKVTEKFFNEFGETRGFLSALIPDSTAGLSINLPEFKRVFKDGGRFAKRRRAAGLHLWFDIKIDEEIPVTRALSIFNDSEFIQCAEPIFIYTLSSNNSDNHIFPLSLGKNPVDGTVSFSDPKFSSQWNMHNPGKLTYAEEGADINLRSAWAVTTGHPDVIVAVIDGGVQYDHEDLAGNMWINEEESNGLPGVDDDLNGYEDDVYGWNFVDDSGEIKPQEHATHVAGIISAVNNNFIGVSSVAGGDGSTPGVRIMSCQVTYYDDQGNPKWGGIEDAFTYAADNGAVIAQCSWSISTLSGSMKAAIDYFIANAGIENGVQTGPVAGGIVVAAADNNNSEIKRYPAAYANVISVGGMAANFKKSSTSNYGTWIDIMAPGGEKYYGDAHKIISTTYIQGATDGYGFMDGTSMACPHVAGIAALIISAYGVKEKGLTSEDVTEMIMFSGRSLDEYNPGLEGKLGAGLVDARKALARNTGEGPEICKDFKVEWMATFADLSWTVTRDSNGYPVEYYRLYVATEDLSGLDPSSVKNSRVLTIHNTKPIGELYEYRLTGLVPGQDYFAALVACDIFGNNSIPMLAAGTTISNYPPYSLKPLYDLIIDGIGESFTVSLNLSDYFADPDPDDFLIYAVDVEGESILASIRNDILYLQPVAYGLSVVTVNVQDRALNWLDKEFSVIVRNGTEIVETFPNPVSDFLTVRVGGEMAGKFITFIFYNSTGTKVMDKKLKVDPFSPSVIDMTKFESGIYNLYMEGDGLNISRKIVKL